MPTILLVNNYHYRRGGADTVYLEQGQLLRMQGWKVLEFSMHHPKNEPSAFSDGFAEEIEYGRDYSTLSKLRHAAKIVYSREAADKIRKLIRKSRPDVVHAHNVYHHLSPSVLHAAKVEGIPVVMTVHDLKLLCPAISMISSGRVCEECKDHGKWSLVRKRCMKGSLALSTLIYLESSIHELSGIYRRSVDRLISPSRFFMDKFSEWNWSGAPFTHIPNFADGRRFVPSSRPGDYFLYFGRLSQEKGLQTLISASAEAGVPLRLVGTGPMEQELRRRANDLSADVEFWGYQSGDALWDRVRACRAVVLPSEWYENAPMSILEAYACGKPVLGAQIGGIPELIRPGITGDMFPSGDVDGLANLLRRYGDMSDAELTALGRECRSWVETEFSAERHLDRLFDAYRSVGAQV